METQQHRQPVGDRKVEALRDYGQILIAVSGFFTGFFFLYAFFNVSGNGRLFVLLQGVLFGLSLYFAWLLLNCFCDLCNDTKAVKRRLEGEDRG